MSVASRERQRLRNEREARDKIIPFPEPPQPQPIWAFCACCGEYTWVDPLSEAELAEHLAKHGADAS